MLTSLRKNRGTNRLLGLSPWILGGACLLLLLLLAFFALKNLQREKQLVEQALEHKGMTIVRFIHSTVRRSLVADIQNNTVSSRNVREHIEDALHLAAEQPSVLLVAVVDGNNQVILGAGEKLWQDEISQETIDLIAQLRKTQDPEIFSDIVQVEGDHGRAFEIAVPFRFPDFRDRGKFRGLIRGPHKKHGKFGELEKVISSFVKQQPIFIVQLDLGEFRGPLGRQLLQIVLQLVVIFLVAVGGALSFITLRGLKGSERNLGEVQAFNEIMVSSLPVGLLATDEVGKIRVCNAKFSQIVDIPQKDLLDKDPENILDSLLHNFLTTEQESEIKQDNQREIALKLKSGREAILHVASRTITDKTGKPMGRLLLVRDETRVKSLEKELQKSERLAALGKMAAGVAHELRNPLSSIKGLAVLLQSKFAEESKESDTADTLVKEVERLNRSIGELLDYAKPGQLNLEEVDIKELLQKTVSLIEVDANSYNINIRKDYEQNMPAVRVDRDKIVQVFLNLFLNSIQAMSHLSQGATLTVKGSCDEQYIIVTVKDSGVGIEDKDLKKIFDPYYTTKAEGTGLGLALSLKIVEEHGGKIEVQSELDSFTEVGIYLPVGENSA